mgnify:CR=1 FL=1
MLKVEELISAKRNYCGKVSIHFHLNGRFIKSPYVAAHHAPVLLCRLIARQMLNLVKQRKRQIRMGYAPLPFQRYQRQLTMLEYRLAASGNWTCQNLNKQLLLCLPDLKSIAPSSGKYFNIWHHFIIGLELLIQQDDIQHKVNSLLQYE